MCPSDNADTDGAQDTTVRGFKRFAYKLCGIPTEVEEGFKAQNQEKIFRERFSKEDPFWKNVLNINAAVGLVVVVFLICYFH